MTSRRKQDEFRHTVRVPRRAVGRGRCVRERRRARRASTSSPRAATFPSRRRRSRSWTSCEAGGRMPGSPFEFFDARGDLLAMRPDVTLQVARMCATRLAADVGARCASATPSACSARRRRTHAGARRASSRRSASSASAGAGPAGRRGGGGACWREALGYGGRRARSRWPWPRWACCARCSTAQRRARRRGRRRVLDAYHASNFVELDRLTDAADPALAEARERRAGVRRGHPRAAAHPRRARGHRGQARALAAPLGCEDGLDDFARTYDLLAEAGAGRPHPRGLLGHELVRLLHRHRVRGLRARSVGTPLGSGGRYDNMIGAYGADRPAAGFAFYLEQALAAAPDAPVSPRRRRRPRRSPAAHRRPQGRAQRRCHRRARRRGTRRGGAWPSPGRAAHRSNARASSTSSCGPTDAPAFVALGAADCGICGKDSLLEAGLRRRRAGRPEVRRMPLRGGRARRRGRGRGRALPRARVHPRGHEVPATSRAPTTRKTGVQVEIVKLHGNIELAPLTGHGRAHRGHHGHRHHAARERPGGGGGRAFVHRALLREHLRVPHRPAHHRSGARFAGTGAVGRTYDPVAGGAQTPADAMAAAKPTSASVPSHRRPGERRAPPVRPSKGVPMRRIVLKPGEQFAASPTSTARARSTPQALAAATAIIEEVRAARRRGPARLHGEVRRRAPEGVPRAAGMPSTRPRRASTRRRPTPWRTPRARSASSTNARSSRAGSSRARTARSWARR